MSTPDRLLLSGDIDQTAVPALNSALETHGAADPLTVDLSEVTYLCSLAVSSLVGAMRAADAAGRSFRLVAAESSPAQQVLRVLVIPHEVS